MPPAYNNLQARFAYISALFFLAGLIAYSCDSDTFFTNQMDLESSTWSWNEPFINQFGLDDTSQVYSLYLEINHSYEYNYSNIYFQTRTAFPSDTVVASKTNVNMAEKSGVWNGQCNRRSCSLIVELANRVRFREVGNYRIEFEQFTREPKLLGINSLSFNIKMQE